MYNGVARTECTNCGITCTQRVKVGSSKQDDFCLYRKSHGGKGISKYKKFEEFKEDLIESDYAPKTEVDIKEKLPTFRS